MRTIKFVIACFLLLSAKDVMSQGSVTVQPEIMVMPYTKENEDVRTILDNNPTLRMAIAKVNEAFSKRGFKPKDFQAALKAAKEEKIWTSENQSDIKSELALFAGADIFITADLNPHSEGDLTNVSMSLSAYEASTALLLSSKQGSSGNFRTRDTGNLATKAVEVIADEFLDMMNNQFTKIREDGKSVKINISLAQTSQYDFESEVPGTTLPFSDQVEEWMSKNAFKGYYKIQGTTKKSMIFSDVHIPFKDPNNGRNYTPNNFALLLYSYLRSLKLSVSKEVKSSTIYITIK